ncbi:MAG TPA: hypothetical protein PK894_01120 [Defluviitoga sp.]|nr:hypothetical protein [Defluviitoga sp.]HOP24727.1 hypothetical protein [Defluviitoga sp.]HPZ28296.1 hypothetical protein [Defluviitoga sp.]HQD62186.1 hypothetical protein [Defluviitoga sp.]
MRFHGWTVVVFLIFFSLSVGLYLLFGRSEVSYYTIEKTPVLKVVNDKYKVSTLDKQLKDIKNLSFISKSILENNIFIGLLDFDFKDNMFIIKPLSKRSYEEFRNISISSGEKFKERKVDYELYGLVLPYYQFLTENLYIELTPTIFVTDLSTLDEHSLNLAKSKYYVFSKDIYRAYSFNQTLLSSIDEYGGIILDTEILENAAVLPILEILDREGIKVIKDFSIYVF